MKSISSIFNFLHKLTVKERRGAAPSYPEPSLPRLYKPESSLSSSDKNDIKKEILSTGDWYNPIVLDGEMVSLKASWMKDFHYYRHQHVFQNLLKRIPSLENLKVLDVGCNEGYYSFAARELGAAYVKGMDLRDINILRANQVKKYFGYDNCEFVKGNIADPNLLGIEPFDIVFCFGVLYHLENPMIAIRNLRALTTSLLVIDSALASFDLEPSINITVEPTENLRAGETGVAFYPSLGGLLKMLECGGFKVEQLPPTEPAFWSPDCGHDYKRNQVTLICQ